MWSYTTELTVREVHQDFCRAIVQKSGVGSYWPDMAELTTDDIVVAPAGRSRTLTILPPTIIRPPEQVIKDLQLRSPTVGRKFRQQAVTHSGRLVNLLAGGIRRLNVRNIAGEAGTTHVVRSTIQRRSASSYQVVMRIEPTKTRQVIHEMTFRFYRAQVDK